MTAYMDYNRDTPEYGQLEQEMFRQQAGSDGRGRLATTAPMERKLQAGMAGQKMQKDMNLMRLGMQKRSMEHEVKMGEGRLAIAKDQFGLNKKQFQWNLKNEAKATNIAKFGVALNLAMGLSGFMQQRKLSLKQDNLMTQMELQQQQMRIDHLAWLKERDGG